MLYNQVELIVSHIYQDKISNSFDITNLHDYFFTHDVKRKFDALSHNVQTMDIKRHTHDKVKRELHTTDIYKNTMTSHQTETHTSHSNQVKYKINQRDTLFWCLYILEHGYLEYMKIQINYGNVYISEKRNVYNNMHTKRDLVKNSNIKITNISFQEIMSDLIGYSKNNINYNMVYAFIAHYKYNIILLNKEKKSFFHFKNSVTENATHLIELKKGKYFNISVENMNDNDINDIYTAYTELHHFDKAMKSMSSYKMEQLRELASRLNIDTTLKKQDLYNEIYKSISW